MLRNHEEWNNMMRHEHEHLDNLRQSLKKNRHDEEDSVKNEDNNDDGNTKKCSKAGSQKLPLKKGGRDTY